MSFWYIPWYIALNPSNIGFLLMRLYKMKYRYLTFINGIPHYQRRYPQDLVRKKITPNGNYKVSLKSDVSAPSDIINEIEHRNEHFESMMRLLRAKDPNVESKVELDNLANSLLAFHNLNAGLLADSADIRAAEEYVSSTGAFDALDEAGKNPEFKIDEASELLRTQHRARQLLYNSNFQPTSSLSQVWKYWQKTRDFSKNTKANRRDNSIWNRFISINGGDALLTEEVIESYLHNYVQLRKQEIKWSSLDRQLTTITSAIRKYLRDHRIKINFNRPETEKDKKTNRKPSLLYVEQVELINYVKGKGDWKELYVYLALHSGLHAAEAVQLTEDDFIFESEIPRFYISGDNAETSKDEARGRIVPITFNTKRIRELVQNGALAELTSKDRDNAGTQISKIIKTINPKASMYSLRHTLAHNVEASDTPESFKSNFGGWVGKEVRASEHMAMYGKDSADSLERLRPLQHHMKQVLSHLQEYEE